MELRIERFDAPHERTTFPLGVFEVLTLGGMTVGRARYEPGWKWSEHVGAATGATSCEVEHVGIVLSGRAAVDPATGTGTFLVEVIDLEGTSRLRSERAALVLACGFRWVNADIEVDDESVSSDMPGITVAADVRTRLCGGYRPRWSGVAGARFSILGADWEGDDGGLIEPTRDDNLVVTELYGGFEYLCQFRNSDLFARLVMETQNWRSDALGESADTDSLGFFGPGIHVGTTF